MQKFSKKLPNNIRVSQIIESPGFAKKKNMRSSIMNNLNF